MFGYQGSIAWIPCVIYDKNYVGSRSYFKLAEEFMKSGDIESAA